MTLVEHALRGSVLHAGAPNAIATGLPWYRSLPLSAMVGVELAIDGAPVPDLRLRVGDRSIPAAGLVGETRSWFLQDRHLLEWDAPLRSGPRVDVVLRMRLQLPNLVGPGGTAVQVLQEVRGTVPVEGAMSSGPRLAVTLFSFTNELLAADRSPDALLEDLLRAQPHVAVEIDGAQHFRSFPRLDPAEVGRTAAVVERTGASVSLLGAGADVAPAPGRLLGPDEQLEQLRSQIAAAAVLSAEAVRIPFGVLPWAVLERAAEDARAAGVLLLEEVQGPADPSGEPLGSRIDDLERTGETAVRLLLDTSALMSGLPPTYEEALRDEGVPESLVVRLGEALADRRVAPVVLPALADDSLTPAAHGLLITAMTRFGAARATDWVPLAPWIAAVHVKWWDLDAAARDLAGEAGAVIDALLGAGLPGTVCSEWGGHEWQHLDVQAAGQVAAHLELLRTRFGPSSTDFSIKPT